MKQNYLRAKDMLIAIKQYYGYDLGMATLNRWRKQHPLPSPAQLKELCHWFEHRMSEKRGAETRMRATGKRTARRKK